MKKFQIIGSTMTAILVAGTMATSIFAASYPADDAGSYSYNTGKQSAQARMTENQAWYDNEGDSVSADYSFNTGSQTAASRNSTFEGIPAEENMEKEDIEAWFEDNDLGKGSAWSDGQYEKSAKNSYGYSIGQAAYQQRHASFADNN